MLWKRAVHFADYPLRYNVSPILTSFEDRCILMMDSVKDLSGIGKSVTKRNIFMPVVEAIEVSVRHSEWKAIAVSGWKLVFQGAHGCPVHISDL